MFGNQSRRCPEFKTRREGGNGKKLIFTVTVTATPSVVNLWLYTPQVSQIIRKRKKGEDHYE